MTMRGMGHSRGVRFICTASLLIQTILMMMSTDDILILDMYNCERTGGKHSVTPPCSMRRSSVKSVMSPRRTRHAVRGR